MRPSSQINTPEFKSWFGNSVVVNPDGTPKVCYHGVGGKGFEDNRYFTEFKIGWNNLIYTAESPQYASYYSGHSNLGGRVYPLYVRIENPIDLTKFDIEEVDCSDFLNELERCGVDVEYIKKESLNIMAGHYQEHLHLPGYSKPVFKYLHDKVLTGAIQDAGYDGIKLREFWSSLEKNKNSVAWCVYDPKQLKSAIGNKGSYKKTHADIGESLAERVLRLCGK